MSTRIWDGAGVARFLRVLGMTLVLARAGGCVRINGGAVEISWVVRSADGRAITDCTCSDPPIARIRLNVVLRKDGTQPSPEAGVGACDSATPCEATAHYEFACQRQTGATPFDIDESKPGEMYEISVTALDVNGKPLPAVQTPAPILRRVVKGQPTQVEAFLLVSACDGDCMNQSGVCTRP